jgi:hypothetical protein
MIGYWAAAGPAARTDAAAVMTILRKSLLIAFSNLESDKHKTRPAARAEFPCARQRN